MNIRDAALRAQKIGKGIARKSDGPRPTMFICTNSTAGIIVQPKFDETTISACWMPTLDYITANDWYVMGDVHE
ncbi:hypothetical protein [Lactobacillus sp. ESL0681]|uniref:hypothetical protein n=1 Tax=Lactobacillus sp. ESL0681 TaxID=2983211 RepID=UPI0023F815B0|nr:hypothetical protein [Lactobacillus sp. ESL0681]WEV40322.1 hypothetical protein OZX59_09160 [Lactobacillus sp. ESL0681]